MNKLFKAVPTDDDRSPDSLAGNHSDGSASGSVSSDDSGSTSGQVSKSLMERFVAGDQEDFVVPDEKLSAEASFTTWWFQSGSQYSERSKA